MSATNDKPTPTEAALILFGTAKGAKQPQAGWIRTKDTDAATQAAIKLGLAILKVDTEATRAIVPSLREVQIKPGGEAVVPVIDVALLQKLTALQADVARAAQKSSGLHVPVLGGSSAARRPAPAAALWNDLAVDSLVLAADLDRQGTPDGWYEAAIIAVDGDTFLVRFRDYPEEGTIKRQRHHIALLYPQV
jgi:hypothetical protein